MDQAEATRAIVTVGEGRGFIVSAQITTSSRLAIACLLSRLRMPTLTGQSAYTRDCSGPSRKAYSVGGMLVRRSNRRYRGTGVAGQPRTVP
jgi:hypothetical protein